MSAAQAERSGLALALWNSTAAECHLRDALEGHFEPGRTAANRARSRGSVRAAVVRCRMARGAYHAAWIDYCREHAEQKSEDRKVSQVYVNYREPRVAVQPDTPKRRYALEAVSMAAAVAANGALVGLWATSLYAAYCKGSGLLFAMDFVMPPAGVLHGAGVLLGVF